MVDNGSDFLFKDENALKEMKAILLSFLFLYVDEKNTEVGAGDLAASSVTNALNKKTYSQYEPTHNMLSTIFNDLTTKGSLPGRVLDIPSYFVIPKDDNDVNTLINHKAPFESIGKVQHMAPELPIESIRNYVLLWHAYISGIQNVTIYCKFGKGSTCKGFNLFRLAAKQSDYKMVTYIRRNSTRGVLIEGSLTSPPCSSNITLQSLRSKLKNIAIF